MVTNENSAFMVTLLLHIGQPKEQDLEFSYTGTFPIDMDIKNQSFDFSHAWLAVLRKKLSPASLKLVLVNLHAKVIPYMTMPALLIDFLTDAFQSQGLIPLLALNGLFTLVQEHGV